MLAAIFAPLISPQNPYDLAQLDVDGRPAAARVGSRPTAATFWLGTDDQGRDMLSAIFYGLRISLSVGVIEHGARARARARARPDRRVLRRQDRDADHAHRRHPALVSGDPDRA